MNSVNIVGRLTRDPELTYTKEGVALAKFGLAVNDKFVKDRAHFFDVTAWRKTGELIAEHFMKGREIAITGALNQDRWEDKEGNNRSKVYIVVDSFSFVGKKE